MTYNINHTTSYYYNNSVSLCHNLAHLTARDCPWQMCLEHDLKISSPTSVLRTRTDYFGNSVTFFTVQEPHKKLEITAHNLVRVLPRPIPDASATPPWEEVAASLPPVARSRRWPRRSSCSTPTTSTATPPWPPTPRRPLAPADLSSRPWST